MFVRIVKMTFNTFETENFQELFHKNKLKIRGFKGCKFLELYRDKTAENVFFTYSYWENEEALENYRNSELFKEVWGNTKKMFSAKPEAWSVDKVWSSASNNNL